jgi:CRP/FNR family transcriptional activator FtrB
VERLLQSSSLKTIKRGVVLFRQGEAADRFYVVIEGQVELYAVNNEGKESVIDIAGPGASFAEEAIFDGGVYPVFAKVVEPARLVVVEAEPFLDQLRNDFDLVITIMARMSYHLRMLVHQISELKLKTTAQRLGSFMLSLTDIDSGRTTVHLPYDKRLLAGRLGMKSESLSRALRKLREIGVTDREGSVTIADIGELRAFCLEDEHS